MILRSSAWRDGLNVEVESLDTTILKVGILARREQKPTKKAEPLHIAELRTEEFCSCSRHYQRCIVEPEMCLYGVYNCGVSNTSMIKVAGTKTHRVRWDDSLILSIVDEGVGMIMKCYYSSG